MCRTHFFFHILGCVWFSGFFFIYAKDLKKKKKNFFLLSKNGGYLFDGEIPLFFSPPVWGRGLPVFFPPIGVRTVGGICHARADSESCFVMF